MTCRFRSERSFVAAGLALLAAAGCPAPPTGDTTPRPPSGTDADAAGDATPVSSSGTQAAVHVEPAAAGSASGACAELVEVEDPLQEASLLAVRAGDAIVDPETATWGERWIREGEIAHAQAGDRHILVVPLVWPGNGAAVALLREAPTGLCVINVWAFGFGGNGLDIVALDARPAAEAEARIELELVGHYRGFYEDPDDESSWVAPKDEELRALLGTDGRRAWLVSESGAPENPN